MAELNMNAGSADALFAASKFLADPSVMNTLSKLDGEAGYSQKDFDKILAKNNFIGSTLTFDSDHGLVPVSSLVTEGLQALASQQDGVSAFVPLTNLSDEGGLRNPEQLEVLSQQDLTEIQSLTAPHWFNCLNPNRVGLNDLISEASDRLNNWVGESIFHGASDFNLEKENSSYKKLQERLKEAFKGPDNSESMSEKSGDISAATREQANRFIELAKQQSLLEANAFEEKIKNQNSANTTSSFGSQGNQNIQLSDGTKQAYAAWKLSQLLAQQLQQLIGSAQSQNTSNRAESLGAASIMLDTAMQALQEGQQRLVDDGQNSGQASQLRLDLYNQMQAVSQSLQTMAVQLKALVPAESSGNTQENTNSSEQDRIRLNSVSPFGERPFWQRGSFWGGATGLGLGGLATWGATTAGLAPALLGFLPFGIGAAIPPLGAAVGLGALALGGFWMLGRKIGEWLDPIKTH